MYEVWSSQGRTRKMIAKFRLIDDANTFLSQLPEQLELEIVSKAAPHPLAAKRQPSPVPKSAGAAEHPGEFIADLDPDNN